ncbi:protein MROH8-like [Dermochelys coriacea]|uniref:protein MROH8-like n=1 Tax=Dermochelys coriacea TaxID=27794 RepID=UPI001CA97B12|nr:protein MROH8-like [Dermochelys coriacea]
MIPALEPELETHLLRTALHTIFTLGTEKDTTQVQDLHKILPELLDAMLGNLLAESPDTARLHYILENSAEFPRMGHHVAQLAVFISDPANDINQQAREGVYRLYQLLLQREEPSWEMAPDRRVRLGPQPISLTDPGWRMSLFLCSCPPPAILLGQARSEDSAHCAATNGIGRTQALQPE